MAGCGCSAIPTPRPAGHPATPERICDWPGSGAFDASLGAIRASAEAQAVRKAADHARAARQEALADSYRALRDLYQQPEHTLARVMTDRQEWEHAIIGSRHLAIAADTELRRRHPGQTIEPLLSAEQPSLSVNLTASSPRRPPGSATWPRSTIHSARGSTGGSAR
jgi:hypothetical protein